MNDLQYEMLKQQTLVHIQFRIRPNKRHKYRMHGERYWPTVPRVGELIHFEDDQIGEIERIKWESDRGCKPIGCRAYALIFCLIKTDLQ